MLRVCHPRGARDVPGREIRPQNPSRSQRTCGICRSRVSCSLWSPQDTEDLDHYEMKEEEPADGKKTEDEGIGKENLAILEKIKKNQRQDYLNVRVAGGRAGGGRGGAVPGQRCSGGVSIHRFRGVPRGGCIPH